MSIQNARNHARNTVREIMAHHRGGLLAAGVPGPRISFVRQGYSTLVLVDKNPIYAITIKNAARPKGPDRVWVEEEYIGAPFQVQCSPDLSVFLGKPEALLKIYD